MPFDYEEDPDLGQDEAFTEELSGRRKNAEPLDFSAFADPVDVPARGRARKSEPLDFSNFADPVETVPLPRARPDVGTPASADYAAPLDDAPFRSGGTVLDATLGSKTGMLSGEEAYRQGQERIAGAQQDWDSARAERERLETPDYWTAELPKLNAARRTTGQPLLTEADVKPEALRQAQAKEQEAERAFRAAQMQPPTQGSIRDKAERVVPAAVGQLVDTATGAARAGAGVIGAADRGISAIFGNKPNSNTDAINTALDDAASNIKSAAGQRLFKSDVARNDDLGSKLVQGVVSTGVFAGVGAAGRAAGLGAGPTTAIAGALPQAEQQYQQAMEAQRLMPGYAQAWLKEKGIKLSERDANDLVKWSMFAAGVGIGATEAVPIAHMFQRLDRASGGGFTRYLAIIAAQAGEEGVQEGVQQLLQNATSRGLINPTQEITKDVAENALVGALSGAMVTGVVAAPSALARDVDAVRQAIPVPEQVQVSPEDIQRQATAAPTPASAPEAAQTAQPPRAGNQYEVLPLNQETFDRFLKRDDAPYKSLDEYRQMMSDPKQRDRSVPDVPTHIMVSSEDGKAPGLVAVGLESDLRDFVAGREENGSSAPTPAPIPARERNLLHKKGYSDDMIDAMSAEERAAELGEATEQGVPDEAPTAEPVSDLVAQAQDLRTGGYRRGVWLPKASLDHLAAEGQTDAVLGAGVPVENFDGAGGTMVARDQAAADEAIAARDAGGDLQAIIGAMTGDGRGKPAGATAVVQQTNADGDVTRERLADDAEVPVVAQEFIAPGRKIRVVPGDVALDRRAAEVADEQRDGGFSPEQLKRLLDEEDNQLVGMWHDLRRPLPADASDLTRQIRQRQAAELDQLGVLRLKSEDEVRNALLDRRMAGETVQPTGGQTIDAEALDFSDQATEVRGDGTRGAPARINDALDMERAASRVNAEPSDAQKEAGNYRKGHVRFAGLDVTIENPAGSTRSGTNKATGESWQVQMPVAYGYVKRTKGADGDHVDVFMGDRPDSDQAFIIDQRNPDTGRFDEHKIMLGFPSVEAAQQAYEQSFSDGRAADRLQAISTVTLDELKAWLREGKTRRPFIPLPKAPRRGGTDQPLSVMEYLAARGGLRPDGDWQAMGLHRMSRVTIPGKGPRPIIRGQGLTMDQAVEALREGGYLPPAVPGQPDDFTLHNQVRNLVDDELRGGRHVAMGEDNRTSRQRAAEQEDSAHRQEQAEAARAEIAAALAEYGVPADKVATQDLDRAAELMAREGLSPEDAFERAVMMNDRDEGMVTDADFGDTYGEDFDAFLSGSALEDGEAAPGAGEQPTRAAGDEDARPREQLSRPVEDGEGEGRQAGAVSAEGEADLPDFSDQADPVGEDEGLIGEDDPRLTPNERAAIEFAMSKRGGVHKDSPVGHDLRAILERGATATDSEERSLEVALRFHHAATHIPAADSEETVNVSLSSDGPWDFNDTWPAPVAEKVAAQEREGRSLFDERLEDGSHDPAQIAGMLDETLNSMMSDFATMRMAGRLLQKVKAGGPLPKKRMNRDDYIKQLEGHVAQGRQSFMDTGAALLDYFSNEAVRAMKVEARRRVIQEEKSTEQLDEVDANRLDAIGNAPTTTERTEAGEQSVIPGAERAGDGDMAQRKADAPLKPKVAQKPADDGLFGDGSKQTDLLDAVAESSPQKQGKQKEIGTNPDGDALFEDTRGVRSRVKDGVRITEPVTLVPQRGGGVVAEVGRRSDEWLTIREASPTWAEVLHALPKDDQGRADLDVAFGLMEQITGKKRGKFDHMTDEEKISLIRNIRDLKSAHDDAGDAPPFRVGEIVRRAPGSKLPYAIEGTVTRVWQVPGFSAFNVKVDDKGPYSASDFEPLNARPPAQAEQTESETTKAPETGPSDSGSSSALTPQQDAVLQAITGLFYGENSPYVARLRDVAQEVGFDKLAFHARYRIDGRWHGLWFDTAGKTISDKIDSPKSVGPRGYYEGISGFATVDKDFDPKAFIEHAFKSISSSVANDDDGLGIPDFLKRTAQPKPAEREAPREEAPKSLSGKFAVYLRDGEFKNILAARRFARENGYSSFDAKQVEESLEFGVVKRAREIVAAATSPRAAFDELTALYERQPKLGTRTSTSMRDQAFSTPVPLGFLASRLAGIGADTRVFEPSAGNGALLIAATPSETIANEINPDRARNLREQGFKVTENDATDATQAKAIANTDPADVVIGNPPFGAVKDGAISEVFDLSDIQKGYEATQIDHAIALRSLVAMRPDGRGVLIVGGVNKQVSTPEGRSKAYNGKAKREFYKTLYDRYNVVDHFTVAGELYERQGAGWPVDVIVIAGKGKSARALPSVEVPRVYRSWSELGGLLDDEIGRHATETRRPDGAAGAPDAAGGPAEHDGGMRADLGGRRVRDRIAAPREPARVQPGSVPAQPRNDDAGGSSNPAELQPGSRRHDGRPDSAVDAERRAPRLAEQETERQVAYQPRSQKSNSLGTLVPVNMRTAVQDSLHSVEQRVGDIDAFVSKELGYSPNELTQYFAAEQIDALALAIDNIKRGAGFIIGDQTGIGKGRVNAAMIRWAIKNDRIPIFFTERPNLYADMYRDLTDIGTQKLLGREPHILVTNATLNLPLSDDGKVTIKTGSAKSHNEHLASFTDPKKVKAEYDMVFTNYSQAQTVRGDDTERRQFLERIAPNAVVIFDESHNAGGNKKTRGFSQADKVASFERRMKKWEAGGRKGDAPTMAAGAMDRAEFARDLVNKATGVFYSSATYAKRPDVMDLYAKTDMRLAVPKIEDLGEAIAKGGVPMQQVVATMLSKAGQYIRRERSFAGIRYDTPEVNVDREQYDGISRALAAINRFSATIREASEKIDLKLKQEAKSISYDSAVGDAGAKSMAFTSIMHNIINQMLLSMKAKPAAQEAIASIRAGEKPVITVANTMESFLTNYAEDVGLTPGSPIDADFSDVLRRYLDRTRTLVIKRPFKEGVEHHYLTDEQLGEIGRSAYANAAKAIDALDLSNLSISPIDLIKSEIERAGYKVGEITGRGTIIDYSGTTPVIRPRPAKDTSIRGRREQISGFNGGTIDAIVINQAGATGISMHASEKFKDQRPRHMILAQPEANIDTHMQMLGRVNRTGQVVKPRYSQLVASIPAEKRPAAVLAKKMASLNANTTASRGGALTAKDVPDFLNEVGDLVAVQFIAEDPETNSRLGNPIKLSEAGVSEAVDAMRKLTGRVPLLPLAEQEDLYAALEGEYAALLRQMEASGENVLEAKTLDLGAKVIKTVQVVEPKGDGKSPFAAPVSVQLVSAKRLGKPMKPTEVAARIVEELGAQTKVTGDNAAAVIDELASTAAVEQTNKLVDSKKKEFEAYKRDVLDNVDKPERLDSERSRLDGLYNRWEGIMSIARPGAAVVLKTNTGNLTGFVRSVEPKGKARNPVAPSGWRLNVMVADAVREVHIPFSRLFQNGEKLPEGDLFGVIIQPVGWEENTAQVLERFERGQSDSREERYIATGNLLAAYDWLDRKGRIINYTDADGSIRQGILTSDSFDLGDHIATKRVVLREPSAVIAWLDNHRGKPLWSDDNVVQLIRQGRDLTVLVPASRRTGGQFFLDRELTDLTGDFFKSNGMMRAQVYGEDVAVISRLQALGANFAAPAGEPPPSVAAGDRASARRSPANRASAERVRLTPSVLAQRQVLTKAVRDALAQVAGPDVAARARIVDEIEGRPEGYGDAFEQPGADASIQGLYSPDLDLVMVAMAGNPDVRATAFHEGWHAIEGTLLPDEVLLLQRETPRLTDYVARHRTDIPAADWQTVEQEEIWAEAAALYLRARETGGSVGGIHIAVRRIFERIRAFLDRLRNSLRGLGFKRAEDVFADFGSGEMAARRSGAQPGRWWEGPRSKTDSGAERGFDKWFGKSKVVDDTGKPMIVYHGTTKSFDAFDARKIGSKPSSALDQGFFFSADPMAANSFASWNWDITKNRPQYYSLWERLTAGQNAPQVYPAFLSIQNPYIATDGVPIPSRTELKAAGYDGVHAGDMWIALEATQIKSAISNNGAFSPTDARLFAQARRVAPTGVTPAPETVREAWQQSLPFKERLSAAIDAALLTPARALWDQQIDIARFQKAAQATNGPVNESLDTYLAATLYPGKVGERMKDSIKQLWEPLYDEMVKRGISREDLADYLYARHAPERNAAIRQIDPNNDAGSGMTDAEARDIFDAVSGQIDDYRAVAAMVDKIVAHNRQVMVRDGLENEATVGAWTKAYRFYVPLKGFEGGDDADLGGSLSSGRGFDVRRPETRRALGRFDKADDVLANLLDQTQRTIIRAEKNRVAKTFLRFAQGNPSPFYKIGLAEQRRRINPDTGLVETYTVIASPERDNVFAAKVGGKTFYIEIKHDGLLQALKTLGAQKMNAFLRIMARLTREYSRFQTAKNPEFVFTNLVRDVQDAGFTVSGEQRAKFTRRFYANLLNGKALYGAVLGTADRGENSQARAWFEEWRAAGGKISHYGLRDIEDIKDEIARELNQRTETTGKRWAMALPRGLNPINGVVVKALEALSDVTETTTRLAVYIAAREVGLSKGEAGRISRSATVDFNKRGSSSSALNALYAFANANIQGNARLLRTLRKSKVARRAALGLIVAGMAVTFWNMAVSPEDKDKKKAYEKRPYWERERNLILYFPGMETGMKLPLGYGLNVFWMIGEQLAMRMLGKVGTMESIGNVLGTAVDAFNPMGSGGSFFDLGAWARNLFPTVLRPIPELGMNRNWTGKPIHPDPMPWTEGVPHSQRHKAFTHPAATTLAEVLNRWSGGNKFQPGVVDIYPDDAEYAWNFMVGGLGRFAANTSSTIQDYANGVEHPIERTPFIRRFVVSDNQPAVESDAYYTKRRDDAVKGRQLRNALKARSEGTDDGSAEQVIEKLGRELNASPGKRKGTISVPSETVFRASDKELKQLRLQQDHIRKDQSLTRAQRAEQIKEVQARMREIMATARSLSQ